MSRAEVSGPEAQEEKANCRGKWIGLTGGKAIPQFLRKTVFLSNPIDSGEHQEFMGFPVLTLCSWQCQFVVIFPLLLLLPDQASPPEDKSEKTRVSIVIHLAAPGSWSEAKSKLYSVVFSPQNNVHVSLVALGEGFLQPARHCANSHQFAFSTARRGK